MQEEEKKSDTTTKNSVSCADNIIRYIISAPVDDKEAERISQIGEEYLNNCEADYVLIDLKQSTQFSSKARKVWVEFLQNEKIKKTAIFGGNVFVRTLASFVIAASKRKNIKFFSTEEDAINWLVDEQ